MAYKIAHLIQFYHVTMERTVGQDALMSKTLSECAPTSTAYYERVTDKADTRITSSAYEAFFATLATYGRSLLRFIQAPPADLAPPRMFCEAISNLRDIMQVYETSLIDDAGRGEDDFDEVLKAALDPPLTMCDRMAELREKKWDRLVFGVNCLVHAQVRSWFNLLPSRVRVAYSWGKGRSGAFFFYRGKTTRVRGRCSQAGRRFDIGTRA
jgi:hypothetical protein